MISDGVCDLNNNAKSWREPDCNEQRQPGSCDIAFGPGGRERQWYSRRCECPDTNGDGFIDVNDILVVIDAWGDCVPDQDCPADVDGDGIVNVNDILLVISEWGSCG